MHLQFQGYARKGDTGCSDLAGASPCFINISAAGCGLSGELIGRYPLKENKEIISIKSAEAEREVGGGGTNFH